MTSLYPTSDPLTTQSSTQTANSTASGLPAFNSGSMSTSVPTNSVQSPVMIPNVVQSVAPTITTPNPQVMYNPQNGTNTQGVADATYTKKILDSASTTGTIPSTDVTSGTTYTSANATRSTNEALLKEYLANQKSFQDKYLSAITPSSEETALQKRVAELKTQAGLNQEQALNSGETSSFAGGEAQRVGRTDALKLAGASEALQALQGQRDNTLKQLQYLQSTNDGSLKTQLEIQKLTNEVSGIDKQAQDTFFNLQQSNPSVDYTYDSTKTPTENLNEFRKLVASQPDTVSTAKQQQTVSQIVGQFDNEPVVKNYNVVAEGYQFAKNLADKPKLTSADNIGLIYAFAKAMDPGSVVREGEYATVQKYAQSWAESFGFNVQRVLTNKEFLTKEAITNLVSTMDAKYAASEQSYRNIESEYNRKINEAKSGAVAGSLTDYSKGYTPSAGGTPKTTTGTGKIYKTKYGDIDGSL